MGRGVVKKIVAVACCITALLSVGGVYATWHLIGGAIPQREEDLGASLIEFTWPPEAILPDDTDIGESHLQLIKMITVDSPEALNKPNSALVSAIEQRMNEDKNTIGSMGVIQGYNMKHYFTTSATQALEFVIEFFSDTEYYVYTFEDDSLEYANAERVWIEAYRTKLIKNNGTWETVNSELGKAMTMYYDSKKGKRALSINVATWVKGKLET